MSINRQQLIGKWGEQVATEYLETNGLIIIERNVRTPYGEIDIVALSGNKIVFVEVKTRSNLLFGMPEEAINQQKKEHLINSVHAFIFDKPEYQGKEYRIDVISIIKKTSSKFEIEWFENAIS